MYETVVLGATFLAAGIATRQKKKCLILEPSFQAGYEFFGALNFGADDNVQPKTEEGQALQKRFWGNGVTAYMRNTYIYPLLQEGNVLFGTQILSVEKKDGAFLCKTFGVDGYSSFTAKNVIDTRCTEKLCSGKTYNLLMESNTLPQIPGIKGENTGVDGHYVLRCPVSLGCGYGQAREAAEKVVRQFSEGQKLILLADEFDYQVAEVLPEAAGGVRLLPSKAYNDPVCAFEAGLEV